MNIRQTAYRIHCCARGIEAVDAALEKSPRDFVLSNKRNRLWKERMVLLRILLDKIEQVKKRSRNVLDLELHRLETQCRENLNSLKWFDVD